MIVYFSDRHFNILGQASTQLPEGLTITDDAKIEDIETGVATFECVIHYTDETRGAVENFTAPGNYILRSSGDESDLFQIIDREKNTKKQEVYIYAEDDGLDLLNEVVGAYEADKAYPISHYINKYALGAGFEIGINEASSLSRKLSWDGESTAAERIASIATQFDGCEISYSFAVDGLFVTKKHINIYKQRGKDVGAVLRLNEDIDSIVTKESIANLATALQCTGGTPEPITNEESGETTELPPITLNGYKYDDGDFYVDGAILKSREALKKWQRLLWKTDESQKAGGHITKQYSYDTLEQSTLCSHAITELKKLREMEVNFEVDINKLPENIRIGDRINIVDDAGELYLSTRVLVLERSEAEQTQKATLGEHLLKSSGIHYKVLQLAEQFAKQAVSVERALAIAKNATTAATTAKKQADSALAGVGAAEEAAQAAQNAANTASQSAEAAQQAANNAQSAVDNVENQVEGLQTTIANAQAAAQQAQQAAETAETKATEAQTAASNAVVMAEEAKAANEETQEKAEEAITKAETAQGTAAQAMSEAEAAATTAAAAKLDAENAQKEIDAFGESLTTLSNTMVADYARKTDLTEAEATLQSQISQNAAQIQSTVESVTRIDETANNAAEQAAQAQSTASKAQEEADKATADAQAAQEAATNAANAAAAAQSEADTAKEAATTAQNVANKAQSDLEAAQKDLETVSSRVDATEEDIIAAQNAVTAAQSAANTAKADALEAVQKAATAQNKADEAATNATNAQTTANEAASQAALAQQLAEEAKGDATAAQNKANEAAETAAEAQRVANTASTNASNAKTAADNAAAQALAAQNAANDADAKAAKAQSDLATAQQNLAAVTSRVDATEEEVEAAKADVVAAQTAAATAKAEAEAAQATADTAKANASAAQTAATNAKNAADKAQADAEAAQAAADAAQAEVDALAVRVTTAETNISQNSEAIALSATKTEVAESLGGVYTKEESDANLTVKANEITQNVSETYFTKEEQESFAYNVESNINQLANEVDISFSSTTEQISGVNGDLQSLREVINKHFTFSENGLAITAGNNTMSLVLDNDIISFEKNGQQFGWWDGVNFHTGNIYIGLDERAQFGNFAFEPRDNGSLDFLKVGG